MTIKEQTRKLATGCSKHCFEVVDKTDEVSSKHGFEVVDEATLTWFEEIFEEYKRPGRYTHRSATLFIAQSSFKGFPDA